MTETEIRFRLVHDGGASDELTATYDDIPIPRVGEYVTVDDCLSMAVFDVNYEFVDYLPENRVNVYMACNGKYDKCTWGCDRENVEDLLSMGPTDE